MKNLRVDMDFLSTFSEYSPYTDDNNTIVINPGKIDINLINKLFNLLSQDQTIVLEENGTIRIEYKSKKKYNRVYTSGCFDLFHYGHLNILKKSKEQCNHLIVGVSTDDLISSDKGRKTVIPYDERVKIIKSIKYVDEVIPQFDKNKQRVVDDHNIDAISVGDDWRGKYPPVTCDMIYIPYTESVSSTILRNTLDLNKK